MRYLTRIVAVGFAGAAAGCSWRQTPVPLIGDPASIVALVGSWAGDYNSPETGRSGTISFELASEKDTAHGDVFMVPRSQSVQALDQDRPGAVRVPGPAAAEPLKIRFVRLESGRVSGTLDTYKDPNCGCTLLTTFDGEFTDRNTIEGTFQTRGTDFGHQPSAGRWKVTRQKSVTRND